MLGIRAIRNLSRGGKTDISQSNGIEQAAGYIPQVTGVPEFRHPAYDLVI